MGPRAVMIGVALSLVLAGALGFAIWAGEAQTPLVSEAQIVQPSRPPPLPAREEYDPSTTLGTGAGAPPSVPAVPSVAEPEPEPVPPPAFVPMPRLPRPPVDPEALARETVLIDRARAELKTDPQTALKSLVEHQQLFPQGALEGEMHLVELEALLRLGRRQEAEELARKLTARDAATKKPVQKLLDGVRPR